MNAANSQILYWAGVFSAVLLITPVVFSVLKRSAADTDPRKWFTLHVIASCLGAVLAVVHSGGNIGEPPTLLLMLLLAVMGIGAWIRLSQGTLFAGRMAARPKAFTSMDLSRREALRGLIDEKTRLLGLLDPQATEAEFSPQLEHWVRSPARSFHYLRLVGRERDIIGARADSGPRLYWSRWVHMALGSLFVAVLVLHIIVATWFSDKVAGP